MRAMTDQLYGNAGDRGLGRTPDNLAGSRLHDDMAASTPVSEPPESGPRWRRALTRGITRNVVALGFVSLFTDISSEMLVYLIPLYLANVLLAPAAVIGLIEGVAESTASVLKLVSGALSDRMNRRRLLVAPRSPPRGCTCWQWHGPWCCWAASATGSARASGPRPVTP
jgi:hypothetical protein